MKKNKICKNKQKDEKGGEAIYRIPIHELQQVSIPPLPKDIFSNGCCMWIQQNKQAIYKIDMTNSQVDIYFQCSKHQKLVNENLCRRLPDKQDGQSNFLRLIAVRKMLTFICLDSVWGTQVYNQEKTTVLYRVKT